MMPRSEFVVLGCRIMMLCAGESAGHMISTLSLSRYARSSSSARRMAETVGLRASSGPCAPTSVVEILSTSTAMILLVYSIWYLIFILQIEHIIQVSRFSSQLPKY
jgi:hypothetical protein